MEQGWSGDGVGMEWGWSRDGAGMEWGWSGDGVGMEWGQKEQGWSKDRIKMEVCKDNKWIDFSLLLCNAVALTTLLGLERG